MTRQADLLNWDGANLRRRRERQGWGLEDVAGVYRKWDAAHVEALEACTSLSAKTFFQYAEALHRLGYREGA
jgi:hypothetical protein